MRRTLCALVLLSAVSAGCRPRPASTCEADSPLLPLPAPPLGVQGTYEDLKYSVTPERVRLGRWLFYDPRLSGGGTLSCAGCHDPRFAFSEQKPHAIGVRGQEGTRKVPPLVNIAYPLFDHFFWDGRASTLIEQAKAPMENPSEMGSSHTLVVRTISAVPGYRRAFSRAWGDERIDIDRVAAAIAAYEATRLSGNSPYDRFDHGEAGALNDKQEEGRALFFGKARCTQCHLGWNFTDSRFHNIGVGWNAAAAAAANTNDNSNSNKDLHAGFADPGRSRISGRAEDTGAFKTPTLRDTALHPPWMHDGSLNTLKEVVELYNKGGTANPWLDPRIEPLHLTPHEVDTLVSFLEALGGEGYQDTPPRTFPE